MRNFHPLKVVGRDSETQLQVAENLHLIAARCRGYLFDVFRSVWLSVNLML